MSGGKFDYTRLRNPFESDEEWDIRLNFLQAHREKFPIFRLLCLSNCYINSEIYGCIYGNDLMAQLTLLKKGLPPLPARIPLGCVGGITFYKETSSAENVEKNIANKHKTIENEIIAGPSVEKKPKLDISVQKKFPPLVSKLKPIKFVAEKVSKNEDSKTLGKERQNIFSLFSLGNDRKNEQISCDKSYCSAESQGTSKGDIMINHAHANTEMSKCTKNAKKSSPQKDERVLQKDYKTENQTNVEVSNFGVGEFLQHIQSDKEKDKVSPKTNLHVLGKNAESNSDKDEMHVQSLSFQSTNQAPEILPPNIKQMQFLPKDKKEEKCLGQPSTATSQVKQSHSANKEQTQLSVKDTKFLEFSQHYRTFIDGGTSLAANIVLPMVDQKVQLVFTHSFEELPPPSKGTHLFRCTVYGANVRMGQGEGPNKKKAKAEAMENASSLILMTYLKVTKDEEGKDYLKASMEPFESAWSTQDVSETTFVASSDPNPNLPSCSTGNESKESNEAQLSQHKPKFRDVYNVLSDFVVIQHVESTENENAKQVLAQSAVFNNALLEYEYRVFQGKTICKAVLAKHHILAKAEGKNIAETKTLAAEMALDCLRKICWKIHIKQAVDSDHSSISRDQVMQLIQKDPAISNKNKGNQLLKKLGWEGGGLGAEGNKGLETPVAVDIPEQITRREGLGLHSDGSVKEFKKKVVKVLEKYARSYRQDDMAFSSEFSDTERAVIHQACHKIGLKTVSRGSGSQRYLTVSRKRGANELFEHIRCAGGETSKYLLVPPDEKV